MVKCIFSLILLFCLSFAHNLFFKNIGKVKSCNLPDDEIIKVYNDTIDLNDLKPYLNLARNLNEKNINNILLGAILDKILEIKLKHNKKVQISYYLFKHDGPKIALDYLSKHARIKQKGNVCIVLYNSTLFSLKNAKETLQNIDTLLSDPIKYCKKAKLSLDECEKQIEIWKNLKDQLSASIKPILFRYAALTSKIYITKRQFLYYLSYLFKNLDLESTKSIVATYRMYDVPILILKYDNGKFYDLLTQKPVSEKAIFNGYVIKGYKRPIKFYKIKNYLKKHKIPFVIILDIPKYSKLTFDICNLITLKKINLYASDLIKRNLNKICVDTSKINKIKDYLK